jgi:hypothetical protein
MPADEGPVGETQGGGAGKPVSRSVRQAFLIQRRPIIFILILLLVRVVTKHQKSHTTNLQFADFMHCQALESPSLNARVA